MFWLVLTTLLVLVVLFFLRATRLKMPKGDRVILHPHYPVIGIDSHLSLCPFLILLVLCKV